MFAIMTFLRGSVGLFVHYRGLSLAVFEGAGCFMPLGVCVEFVNLAGH